MVQFRHLLPTKGQMISILYVQEVLIFNRKLLLIWVTTSWTYGTYIYIWVCVCTARFLDFTLFYREGLLTEEVQQLANVSDAGDAQVHLQPSDPN